MKEASSGDAPTELEGGGLARRGIFLVLLVMLVVAVIGPVYAHTTLGNLNGSSPLFRSDDHPSNPTNRFTGRVPGPVGYVWPGGGLNTYSGDPSQPPGYQSPFTTFERPLQVSANSYAPEGAILTSTSDHDYVGDLIFAINFSQPLTFATESNPTPSFSYGSVAIYIPAPVFDKTGALIQDGFEPAGGLNWDGGENTNIVTTVTDNYGDIFVTRADRNDPFQPGSWLVYITASAGINFTAARGWPEWYYIRVNQMKAPHVAGRYFFKIFLNDSYPVRRQETASLINSTMPVENWPVLLVKGEVDPGIIYGTMRHGNTGSALYNLPLHLPGRVRVVGVATHPVTGEVTGRAVEARGHFNASAQGHFEVEGVAPGIYDIYASAAGYPEQRVAEGVRVRRGQSVSLDLSLQVGPEIRGRVFSKGQFGSIVWPGQRPISVLIYDSDIYDPDSIVAHSPTNLTHAPFTSYTDGDTRFSGDRLIPPSAPRLVAFPWEGPVSYCPFTPTPTFRDPYGLFNGVGPAQEWWVDPLASVNPTTQLGSSASDFTFQFGSESSYGTPTRLSGMVPQVFAAWTDGLQPGTYYLRVYVNGYVQTAGDGVRFIHYPFTIPDITTPRNVFLPIDVFRSPSINITVHFHNLPDTITDSVVGGPDPKRFLIAEAFGRDGALAAFNFTQVFASVRSVSLLLNGFGMAGPIQFDPLTPDPRANIKYSLARYRGLFDYGLLSDTYTIRVFMRGYIQALPPATMPESLDQPVTVSLSIGTGVAEISTHMYRGCGINATIYSVDWEIPPVARNWIWQNAPVSVLVYDVASQAFVDVIYFWASDLNIWTTPTQSADSASLPWPEWETLFGAGSSFLATNGSTLADRFGPDIPSFPSPHPSQDVATVVFFQENFGAGFLYSSTVYRSDVFRSNLAIYPGVYALNVWTYGYVQENVARLGDLGDVHVSTGWLGAQADASLHAVIGVNFTMSILFKTEGLISGTPYNASVRIRVFDDADTLVAAATLSAHGGRLVPTSSSGFLADGRKLVREQTIPSGAEILTYVGLAGLLGYVEPSTGGQGVQQATLFSPDHGVWGRWTRAGSYSGSWRVMVDFVNWYLPSSFSPPVPALLQGESPYFFPYNHLGPYRQETYPVIPTLAQGGEASIVFEVDLRGYVQGIVMGIDWNDAVRTVSWATVQLETDSARYFWYSWDGWFEGYLDAGSYRLTLMEWTDRNEGHATYRFEGTVSAGQMGRSQIIVLDLSGIPIPELSPSFLTVAVGLSVACGAFVARKIRRGES